MDEAHILRVARQNGGRYLLPRRWRKPKPWQNKTEIDRLHDACEALVKKGVARWLTGSFEPGIELTADGAHREGE